MLMSFDLAVWFPHKRLSDEEAGDLYRELCESKTDGVVPHPAIDAFYREIIAKHPEIDNVPESRVDDFDFCPWSVAFDRSGGHLIICSVWSKAEYVAQLILDLAKSHGLAVYSPQGSAIQYPDDDE
jgi:hypothetical protein